MRAATTEMESCGGEWSPGETRSWEPLSRVRDRVLSVLRRHQREQGVIVVCHGLVITALTGKSLSPGEYTAYKLRSGIDKPG